MRIISFIDDYLSAYTNYKPYWNYEDGCVLNGCRQLYCATGSRRYYEFIKAYTERFVNSDGVIINYEKDKFNIDSVNSSKLLFFMYEQTNESRYRKAVDFQIEQLIKQPRTRSGSFWHKGLYPSQIWLDGLYMALPFYAEYEVRFNDMKNYGDIINQFDNARRLMYDENKGLYYHAYDETGTQQWADKVTGLSANFWLRSMGWYLMALIDVIAITPNKACEYRQKLERYFNEALNGILQYIDKDTKLFYQLIDKQSIEGNYTETSGSAMIAYSIIKACATGVLPKQAYLPTGMEILNSITENKMIGGELTDICLAAGLGPGVQRSGSVEYYLSEKRVSNDAKGVGAFMMAYAQMLMLDQ